MTTVLTHFTPQIHKDAEFLKAAIHVFSGSDLEFVLSLLKAYAKNKLSDKQAYWVGRMAEKAEKKVAGVEDAPPVGEKVGEFSGVYALFQKAKQHLKYPKISLQLTDGSPLQLSLSGPKSVVPNVINLTDGGSYGSNKWYGRVYPDGKYVPSKQVSDDFLSVLKPMLQELAEAPEKTALKYAKLTGNCCFCGLPLSDEHSTAVGFGPVCAKNWGLYPVWKKASPVLKGEKESLPVFSPKKVLVDGEPTVIPIPAPEVLVAVEAVVAEENTPPAAPVLPAPSEKKEAVVEKTKEDIKWEEADEYLF